MTKEIKYTCIGKGGEYVILHNSKGAGTSKGQEFVTYQDVTTGETYVRELSDFRVRMQIIQTDVVY